MSFFTVATNVSRLCDRAGLFTKLVLLKTLISRIRNLSTEDGFPAWRIADVELNPYGIAPFKNNTNLSSRKPL